MHGWLYEMICHTMLAQWRSKCGFKIGDGTEEVCRLRYKKLQLPHVRGCDFMTVLAYCYVIAHSVDTGYPHIVSESIPLTQIKTFLVPSLNNQSSYSKKLIFDCGKPHVTYASLITKTMLQHKTNYSDTGALSSKTYSTQGITATRQFACVYNASNQRAMTTIKASL